jgi:diguanylate cyclase (GGDEF)-like protein/PAS domain S-box-containing protein
MQRPSASSPPAELAIPIQIGDAGLRAARAEAARAVDEAGRLRALVEQLPAGVYLDRYRRSDGAYLEAVYISPYMSVLTGYPIASFTSDPQFWLTLIHPDDRARVIAVDVKSRLPGDRLEDEYRITRADGRVIWIREEGQVTTSSDPDTILAHGFLTDVTDRKVLEQQLNELAFHDTLTGLANRWLFDDRLGLALARSPRTGLHACVLFLDLDGFKSINDTFGHATGDLVLKVVADRIRASVRPGDCVARVGGDEFAILLETTGSAGAITTAKRLLRAISAPIEVEGRQLTVRTSIGIGAARDGGRNDLLRDADLAMYHAKAAGDPGWALLEPEIRTLAV